MTTLTTTPRPSARARVKASAAHGSPALLAVVATAVIFTIAVRQQPGILSTSGLTLVLMSAVPLVLAAQAQMLIMAVGDVDLGVGFLIGLVTVIASTLLTSAPLWGALALIGLVAAYAVLGAAIEVIRIPSIIVTLGMSFVWLGLGLQLLPTPGGQAPAWLTEVGQWRPEWAPAPLLFIAAITIAAWWVIQRSRLGARVRALGSNQTTLRKLGWSTLRVRVQTYTIAAVLLICAGLMLAAQTRSGDINSASNFTLMSIVAVVIGGGSFAGGTAHPVGATFGAISLGLIGVLLSLASVASHLQSAAQGLIVLALLAGRIVMEKVVK